MIHAALEMQSVATAIKTWERCEYVAEVAVALGCMGEFIAEYTDLRTDEWRHTLGRRSLLILILGIGGATVSLIKTNALSGQKIDSLGDKAREATDTAYQSAESADTAKAKSEQAAIASGRALEKSTRADVSAANALSLASSAQQEADSFEKDIVTAKKQAADAESHLAEAVRRAAEATVELQSLTAQLTRLKSPRSLTNKALMVSMLAPFKGTEYTFASVASDEEALSLLKNIDDVLQRSGWKRGPVIRGFPSVSVFGSDNPYAVPVSLVNGVRVSVDWPEDMPLYFHRRKQRGLLT